MTTRLGISGRIAAFFQAAQITPLLALVALLLGAVRGDGHAARGRAADQRDDGQRARALPGRLGARRRAAWSPRRPSRCWRRSPASST